MRRGIRRVSPGRLTVATPPGPLPLVVGVALTADLALV
ncbi:MAG: hypothetical protein AVDCRST_MAG88-1151 [uncultured Thermomicrobiales bacterium]|uniref:Uncharacterized protein n=1 Tax=uncultured Thermomicrobiales bacterium TaxID=1645740 RepID=A0A6J4UP23_9BACT|nr:MAG: hypothetical protein AVDCRST_MAG88-1151 [uncultured Thermomicrobiales bacterium]